jgi:hypothetical protein
MSASSTLAVSASGRALVSGAPTSTPMPASPRSRPRTFVAESRSPRIRKCASNAVQIGDDAPKTDTSPLGTYCSDQKMTAQLDPVLTIPTTIADTMTRRSRGNRCRNASDSPMRTIDTATARSNAKTNGGTASTPTLIAAQVEPQSAMSKT